jgi:transposase-like protein
MVKEKQLASAGTFCPNKECRHYARVDESHIIKFGRSGQDVQRYHCKGCQTTFTATRATLFYRKHTPVKDILETLALLAEGVRISSLARTKRSYLSARYVGIKGRRGSKKAAVAVGHSTLVIALHILKRKEPYEEEFGEEHYRKEQRCSSEAYKRRLVRKLERLGHKVALEPLVGST